MSETMGAATEALSSAFPEELDQPESPSTPPSTPAAEAPAAPATPEAPASREVDISHLPEEAQLYIRARERELQGDATRKWQEAAELRKQAEQSIAFVEALNSDPTFAAQVRDYLASNLDTGYEAPEDDFGVDYGTGTDPYQAEIAELQQWKAQMEEQMQVQRLSADLDRQIAELQSQNPDWTRQDMGAIIDLGFATQGNLAAAADMYRSIQDRTLTGYLDRKGSVTAPALVPNTGGSPVVPPASSDDELRQAALERIRAELG